MLATEFIFFMLPTENVYFMLAAEKFYFMLPTENLYFMLDSCKSLISCSTAKKCFWTLRCNFYFISGLTVCGFDLQERVPSLDLFGKKFPPVWKNHCHNLPWLSSGPHKPSGHLSEKSLLKSYSNHVTTHPLLSDHNLISKCFENPHLAKWRACPKVSWVPVAKSTRATLSLNSSSLVAPC